MLKGLVSPKASLLRLHMASWALCRLMSFLCAATFLCPTLFLQGHQSYCLRAHPFGLILPFFFKYPLSKYSQSEAQGVRGLGLYTNLGDTGQSMTIIYQRIQSSFFKIFFSYFLYF